MKIVKALVLLRMARSGAEANRMVKSSSILAGGCIPPCNPRLAPYTPCHCDGWRKITNPSEDVTPGTVLRVKEGNWRLLIREGSAGANGTVYDQVPGIGRVPEEL